MDQTEAREVLDLVARFQTRAQKIKRYEKNPFVEGDNIAEHLARGARLIAYIAPALRSEFPDQPKLVEHVLLCFLVHDDDEIIDGFDVPTAIKAHNAKDGEEIAKFTEAVATLSMKLRGDLVGAFGSFRKKEGIPARIAKAVDNIVGNQLVIEQEIGLVSPDSARFCIEYAEKVTGRSKATDSLAAAQIQAIVEFRDGARADDSKIEELREGLVEARLKQISKEEDLTAAQLLDHRMGLLALISQKKMKELLETDVLNHVLNQSKVYTPIDLL